MARRKVKKKFLLFAFLCMLASCFCFAFFNYFRVFDINKIDVKSIKYKNKNFTIKVSDFYGPMECSVTDDVKKAKWVSVKGNVCKYEIKKFGDYDIYFKNNSGVKKINSVNKLFYVSVKKKKYYIATGNSVKFLYDYVSVGGKPKIKSNNSSIAYVKDDRIYTKASGKTDINIDSEKVNVVATNLIDKMPKNYNYDRSYLYCNAFSSSEAKLLDEVLFDRVKEAGEKTRAGVVAAARFLTLEFPYRISYFSENGRLIGGAALVDGEGRYYHKGLYLSEDKFDDIKYTYKGPAIWGCSIYSKPSKGDRRNGLDCSGFTTWVVLNGGFDIGDLGARGKHPGDDLNQFGKEVQLTREIAMSNKIKAGDLLGEVSKSDGHSAIVIGVDNNNYYVAESLWEYPLGVNVNTYKKSDFANHFETVNLMDSYYKKQGNYTAMWY